MKRREDLETNDISCIWLKIIQEKGKSFLIGNLYRPPVLRLSIMIDLKTLWTKYLMRGRK